MSNNLYSSAVIDLTTSRELVNPSDYGYKFKEEALFWFIIKSHDVFEKEAWLIEKYKFAFRAAWIFPYELDGSKVTDEIYFIYAMYQNETYFFDKDPIREKHIWKDVEWGKRAKNYNTLGKDPGTVWIKIIDDGKANTIGHEPYDLQEVIQRIHLSSVKIKSEKLIFFTPHKIKLPNEIKVHNL